MAGRPGIVRGITTLSVRHHKPGSRIGGAAATREDVPAPWRSFSEAPRSRCRSANIDTAVCCPTHRSESCRGLRKWGTASSKPGRSRDRSRIGKPRPRCCRVSAHRFVDSLWPGGQGLRELGARVPGSVPGFRLGSEFRSVLPGFKVPGQTSRPASTSPARHPSGDVRNPAPGRYTQ